MTTDMYGPLQLGHDALLAWANGELSALSDILLVEGLPCSLQRRSQYMLIHPSQNTRMKIYLLIGRTSIQLSSNGTNFVLFIIGA